MKRYLIAVLMVCCIAAVVLAVTNEVTSVNVVGYSKVTVPPGGGLNMVALQFDAFDNTLLGVFGTNQLVPGTAKSAAKADQVFVWDVPSQSFNTYALNGSDGKFYNVVGWPSQESTNTLISGQGFWIKSSSTSTTPRTVVLMGEVVSVLTQRMDIVEGLQQVGYPFSADIELQDTDFVNDGILKGTAKSAAKADKIYLWNGVSYDTYALNSSDDKWYKVVGWPGTMASNTISLGQAFFYERKTNAVMEWSETNRYIDNL